MVGGKKQDFNSSNESIWGHFFFSFGKKFYPLALNMCIMNFCLEILCFVFVRRQHKIAECFIS